MPLRMRGCDRPILFLVLLGLSLLCSLGLPSLSHALGQEPVVESLVQSATEGQSEAPVVELIQQGRDRFQAGDWNAAEHLWQQALTLSSGQPQIQALVWNYLASVYGQMGQWTTAETAIATSVEYSEQVPDDHRLRAQILTTQGHLSFARGQFTHALTHWQAANDLYQQSQDLTGQLGSQINQARALQALGLYRRSRDVLARIQQTLQSQEDPGLQVLGFRQLGNALRVIGDGETSQQVLEQALAIATDHALDNELPTTLISLGNTVRSQGNLTEALTLYQRAIAVAPTENLRLQAEVSEFALLVDMGQLEVAQLRFQHLQEHLAATTLSPATLYARIQLVQALLSGADVLTQISDIPTVADWLAIAYTDAITLGDHRAESYTLGYLGKLYESTQQWHEAQRLTEQALVQAQSINAPDIAYQWQWQLGRILEGQGYISEAIAAYTTAVQTLDTLRSDLVATDVDVQSSFRENVEPVYRQLVSLLLDPDAPPNPQALQQAREVIESLRLAELENFFREACVDAPSVQVDQIDPRAAVIYPIILRDRLEVILSLPQQPLRHYSTPLSQTEMQQAIDAMRQSLRRTAFESEYLPASQRLYDWVIRPMEADLAASDLDTLVFALDTPLQSLPIAAFHTGEHYLIEQYNIALTPGLQLLAPQSFPNRNITALVGGLSEAHQGFSALPGVEQEVEQIEAVIPAQVLLNQAFTPTHVQQQINLNPTAVVHLATHGQFSSSAEDTFLLTWDDRINVRQLDALLRSRDVVNPHPIELLILSACQTAVGDRRAALGLAGMAVRSGARSTLATLWLVNDQATADLMSTFYQQLPQATTKGEALRQAQLHLLEQPQYKHPYYWAAFVLLGNWL